MRSDKRPLQEFVDPMFQICIVWVEGGPCTGLPWRWRLTANTIPDLLRLLAGSNLIFRTEGRAAAIAVGA